MKNYLSLILLAIVALSCLSEAKVGDRCRTPKGSGTCKKVGNCTKGFSVPGYCPNDPKGVKCCVSKTCNYVPPAPQIGRSGLCIDKNYGNCAGGVFRKGFCPGGNSVQCCVKNSGAAPKPKPAPPTCKNFKILKQSGIDDIVFSRKKTKEFQSVFKKAKNVLEICAVIGGIVGEGVGGVPCAAASIGVGVYIDHADECEDKNQCFSLKDKVWPACRGGKDCC